MSAPEAQSSSSPLESGSFGEEYERYVKKEKESGGEPCAWGTFYRAITEHRPMLRTTRMRQDMCSACFRLNSLIAVCTDPVTKAALVEEKETHFRRDIV